MRCMNILPRYCTEYLGDFGIPADEKQMDFSGWLSLSHLLCQPADRGLNTARSMRDTHGV